jgi:NAD(P)-dependent dehydrogenase (short-subunit alcohol dehydrogenase family)
MDLGLSGRVAIVTGASRGIGYACAAELAAEGAHVVAVSRDAVRNAAAADALLAQAKGRVIGAPADLNDPVAVHTVFARTMTEFGRLDILVNCAAVIGRGDFFGLGEVKWAKMFDDKLHGTARCIRLAAPLMRQRKWGRIINVLGGAARQPQPAAVSVGLNNAAILNLTKALANDLAKDNVLVNAVIPSVIHSERLDDTIRAEAARTGKPEAEMRAQRVGRIPLGRMGEGREVGAVVAFLASERASFVTGCAWPVDGGAAAAI